MHVHAQSLTSFWFVQWRGVYSTGDLAGRLHRCCFCKSETNSHGAAIVTE